ncbi:DUF397 domain-containing protein [Nonomuraea sp. 10N515B]|uniref:DUF397 domain-containing protein n=1 Tax=Nonomuraea sp. 10N515B TaxID=3457422 RepID=UPI003FCE16B3
MSQFMISSRRCRCRWRSHRLVWRNWQPRWGRGRRAMLVWVKSVRSTAEGDNCVEVAAVRNGVLVRSSKDPNGPMIHYTRAEWAAFLDGARKREFEWARLRRAGIRSGRRRLSQDALSRAEIS